MSRSESDLRQELKQQLVFEELLSDISTRFINLPVDLISGAIVDAQQQICKCLGFDVSSLWQWSDNTQQAMSLTHLFGPSDGPKPPKYIDGAQAFPWTYQKMMNGLTMVVTTEQLPPEAAQDQASRRLYGIKSAVNIPLMVGGNSIVGILTFSSLHREMCWTDREIRRLELVAQIFTNSLLRKQTEETLRKNEERLLLAADSAEAGIWEYDCQTKVFWVTPRVLEIFGYAPQEQISRECFEKLVHPDDLDRVLQAMNHSFEQQATTSVEFRILAEPNIQKWICSRGRPSFDAQGNPIRLLGISIDISRQKQLEGELKQRLEEVESLKQRLENENACLREELRAEQSCAQMIGKSQAFTSILAQARQVAPTDATVLISGPTGTGKGMLASTIHQMSSRKDLVFVTVNCAALSAGLIESELFGKEKGAFTGAHAGQAGRFEIADRGTIFLDEIGELSLEMQAKLLRVLEDGEFERLGSSRTIKIGVRVIAATGRNLREDVRAGRFREDLFYRLNVFPITMPPLTQRTEDIPLLARYFLQKYASKMGKQIDVLPSDILNTLTHSEWPGNVRELEHLIERSVIISSGSSFTLADQAFALSSIIANKGMGRDLAAVERNHITQILRETRWKIDGVGGAATILDLHPSTLRFRIKKLGIQRPV